MAGKSKFQISKTLDERIKAIVNNVDEFEPEFAQIDSAYILGSHFSNTTNYVGLTTNYWLYHAGLVVVGLVFFKTSPSTDDVESRLRKVVEYSSSSDGLGSFKADKNNHLFLVYSINKESNELEKRIFNLEDRAFLEEKVKLSVLDDAKIYAHSCIVNVNLFLRINVSFDEDVFSEGLNNVKLMFSKDTKKVRIHLLKSNYSSSTKATDEETVESLYDHLDPPDDIFQMGDYLPQVSKSDKAKLVDKWRNKVKSQRAPLEIKLEHEEFSEDDSLPTGYHGLKLDFLYYLQVNDSISKALQTILYVIRHKLDSLHATLTNRAEILLETGELRSCIFKPAAASHLVPCIYAIPTISAPNYRNLATIRSELHRAYLIPMSRPQFRYSQRVLNPSFTSSDELSGYLCNVHAGIQDNSGIKGGLRNIIQGTYTYHHYMQDRISDSGWGCAYRSLQTIISWFKHQGYIYSPDVAVRGLKCDCTRPGGDKTNSLRLALSEESRVPTHEEIQSVLVDVGDKQPSFIGSQKWIGSQEVCYVLNHLYDLDSKFISVSSGGELVYKARELGSHFVTQSTPIMIGGGVLAHTIIGVDFNEKNGDTSYLILDPHYTGSEDLATITKKGWCGWKKNAFWDKNAFYNLCLPQRPREF